MSVVFQEGFDIYGDDNIDGTGVPEARMLSFGWASVDGCVVGDPRLQGASHDARTGPCALMVRPQSGTSLLGARLILPAADDEFFFHWAVYMDDLPDDNVSCRFIELLDNTALTVGVILLGSDGSLIIKNEAGTVLATTSPLTITAGNFISIQLRWKKHASTGAVKLLVNGIVIEDLTGVNTGSSNIAQTRWRQNSSVSSDCNMWIDDLVINDTNGAENTGFLGDVRVAVLYARADDETGWTPNRRHKFGNGICQFDGDADGLTCSDNVQFEFGSGDFTLETFSRWLSTPSGLNRAHLFGKWRESTNERSYRLFLGSSSVNNKHLQFETSSDGTAGTVAVVCDGLFEPVQEHWYHVCVQRASGVTVIFVDGVPLNAPAADATTYNDNASLFAVGGLQSGASTMLADSGIEGFLEEVRVTKGVARYNMTGFSPPVAAYGRSVGADPDFAGVSLLLGFDTAIIDESSFGRAVTARGNAARYAPDDAAPGAYKTVNQVSPRDDTGVEAPYVAASNVLTFSGQPANNDTVTVDGTAYTFKTVFVDAAGNILIGASVSATIDNLVSAINGAAGAGTVYGTGTAFSVNASAINRDNDQMEVTANTPGAAGNAVGTTESGANTAWSSGTTLAGGLDIPGPSSFLLTRLPPATTGVRAITLVSRAKKTDSGDGTIQASFVTADDSSANGDEHPLTTSDAYYSDVIELDPSTSAGLTPASFVGARFRIDRTE